MANTAGQATWLERDPGVLWRRVLNGVLVLAPGGEEPLHITAPGDIMWQLLAEPCTVDLLVEDLAAIYDTRASVVRADVEPVLGALLEAAAIRELSPRPWMGPR